MRRKKFSNWGVQLLIGGIIFAGSQLLLAEPRIAQLSPSLISPFISNELLVQFKGESKFAESSLTNPLNPTGFSQLDSLNCIFGLREIQPLFPSPGHNLTYDENTELPAIYRLKFTGHPDSLTLITSYRSLDVVDFVEFNVYYFADRSNIKLLSSLSKLQVPEAAALANPGKTVIIGIVDTGLDWDWDQNQLVAKVWQNPSEQSDGKDNDGNGFVDDIYGWNFVDPELLRQIGYRWQKQPLDDCGHGTRVAETINQISNYHLIENKYSSRADLMILKAGLQLPDGNIVFTSFSAAQAIIYAANHGARIINLSWSGKFPSKILHYAVHYAIKKGCTIIAAAGNDDNSLPHYPAAFEDVLAIAATDFDDRKLAVSNYGQWIDVTAPGMITTDSSQSPLSGSSFAAAHVSGLAGLLLSCVNLSDNQSLSQRIIWSSENIYDKNPNFWGQLGAGRINALRAINSQYQPNIIIQKISFNQGNKTQFLRPGKIVPLIATIKNLSATAYNLKLKIQTSDPYLRIVNSEITLPELSYQTEFSNKRTPFLIMINNDCPPEHEARLILMVETTNSPVVIKEFSFPVQINPPQNVSLETLFPVTLKWNWDAKFCGYHIYRKNLLEPVFIRISDTTINDSTFIDHTADRKEQYVYYVTGIDPRGWESLPSETVSITAQQMSPPSFFSTYDTTDSIPDSIKNLSTKFFIQSVFPKSDTTLSPGDSLICNVSIRNNKDSVIRYSWLVNGKIVPYQTDSVLYLYADSLLEGENLVKVRVTGGDTTLVHAWNIVLSPLITGLNSFIFLPVADTTIGCGDTAWFKVKTALENLTYDWFINGKIDSVHHESLYGFIAPSDSSGKTYISVTISIGDSVFFHYWSINYFRSTADSLPDHHRALKIVSCFPPVDSLLIKADSLQFKVNSNNSEGDSLRFIWLINNQIDTAAHGASYWYHPLEPMFKNDTVTVTIMDRDTSISLCWILWAEMTEIKSKPVAKICWYPEQDSLIATGDTLTFWVRGITDSCRLQWLINGVPDTSARDTIFHYQVNSSAIGRDTVAIFVMQADTVLTHQWLVYVSKPKILPCPRLISPIAANLLTDDDLFVWENDSTLIREYPKMTCNYILQLSTDSTFTEIISSDTCKMTDRAISKTSNFNRIPIGKPLYWRVKIISGTREVSEFATCRLPFFYYPLFSRLETFYGQMNEHGGIDLFWSASYDKNCAGFNLYRSESTKNDFKKINDNLITGHVNYFFHDLTTEAGTSYSYKLEEITLKGRKKIHNSITVTAPAPKKYSLSQNYPNPFNTLTSFEYEIPKAVHVTISVYNVLGRKVKTLVDEKKEPGVYTVYWDGNDDQGRSVVSGVYFYHLTSSDCDMTHKMLVVR